MNMQTNKKINKILLINPRNQACVMKDSGTLNFGKMFPLGVAYLAAYLEQNGYQTAVIDMIAEGFDNHETLGNGLVRIGLSDEKLIEKVRQISPDIIGISNLFSPQDREVKYLAELLKENFPEIKIIVGGAHPSCAGEIVLRHPAIDYIIIGEGEKPLTELLQRLNEGMALDDQPAIGFKKLDGTLQINKQFNFIEDLDTLPMPAYHLFDMNKYYGKMAVQGERLTEKFMPMITSRGCPFLCTFCTANQVWGRKYRKRSPENIVQEMKFLKEKYEIEEVVFEDDNITLDMPRAEKLFDLMIENNLNLKWTVPNGIAAYALTPELISKMKASGCQKINFAIESGSQRVLSEVIQKPLNLEKVAGLIKHSRKIGLDVGAFFIFGMPGETLNEVRETFRYIRKHKLLSANISVAFPLLGSKIYDTVVENGYFVNQNSYDDIKMLSNEGFQIQTPDWTAEELRQVVRSENAKSKFYIMLTTPRLLFKFLGKSQAHILTRTFYEISVLFKSKKNVKNDK